MAAVVVVTGVAPYARELGSFNLGSATHDPRAAAATPGPNNAGAPSETFTFDHGGFEYRVNDRFLSGWPDRRGYCRNTKYSERTLISPAIIKLGSLSLG